MVFRYEPFRLISNKSILGKVLLKLIDNKIANVLKNTLIDNQHDFRKNRSSIINLATFRYHIIDAFSSYSQIGTVYIYIEQAFDIVNHIHYYFIK